MRIVESGLITLEKNNYLLKLEKLFEECAVRTVYTHWKGVPGRFDAWLYSPDVDTTNDSKYMRILDYMSGDECYPAAFFEKSFFKILDVYPFYKNGVFYGKEPYADV